MKFENKPKSQDGGSELKPALDPDLSQKLSDVTETFIQTYGIRKSREQGSEGIELRSQKSAKEDNPIVESIPLSRPSQIKTKIMPPSASSPSDQMPALDAQLSKNLSDATDSILRAAELKKSMEERKRQD